MFYQIRFILLIIPYNIVMCLPFCYTFRQVSLLWSARFSAFLVIYNLRHFYMLWKYLAIIGQFYLKIRKFLDITD
jgi:hypothetical protein